MVIGCDEYISFFVNDYNNNNNNNNNNFFTYENDKLRIRQTIA